jgi:hypothetical protein
MKKINWLDHIANLLVVILGISIAFYLEGYKAEKELKSQEIRYLESLVKDFETDIEALDTLKSINNLISEALVQLSNTAARRGQYESDTLLADHMVLIQYNPPFTPQRTTYESIKSSGKMDLIGDFDLRNHIIEIHEQYYRGSNEYDEAINQNLRDFIKPFYMHNVRFTSGRTISSEFMKKGEFANMIFAYRFLFISKKDFYENIKVKTQELIVSLKERINQLKD